MAITIGLRFEHYEILKRLGEPQISAAPSVMPRRWTANAFSWAARWKLRLAV